MADKPVTTDVATGAQYTAAVLNDNFATLETAVEGCLGRGGTGESPNSMEGVLDMDLHQIQNLPVPVEDKDAANKAYVDGILTTVLPIGTTKITTSKSSGSGVNWDAVNTNNICAVAETYAELKAITPFIDGDGVSVLGRSAKGDAGFGIFYWDSSDLSAHVTIDTLGGIWVPPNTDPTGASGAWVRLHDDVMVPDWFKSNTIQGTTEMGDAFTAAALVGYYINNSTPNKGLDIRLLPSTYLINTTTTMGNLAATVGKPVNITGDKRNTIVKTTAVNINPFLFQGLNPDVDGAGNRTGNITVSGIRFDGPTIATGIPSAVNTNSIGIKFYGCQNVLVENCYFNGWHAAEHYQNCDVSTRRDVWIDYCYDGVQTSATGYAISGAGQFNSFNNYGGQVGNCTNIGISYVGGLAPCFFGVNFTKCASSLVLAPNNAGGPVVAVGPVIHGCYFEEDTSNTIVIGGGNGIVRGISIEGGFIIATAAVPVILVANYSDSGYTPAIGNINIGIDLRGGATNISQASSGEEVNFIDKEYTGQVRAVNFDGLVYTATVGGTAVGPFINSGLFVVRDNVHAGSAVIHFDANFGISIISQLSTSFVLGAPGVNQVGLTAGPADASSRKQLVITSDVGTTSVTIIQLTAIQI